MVEKMSYLDRWFRSIFAALHSEGDSKSDCWSRGRKFDSHPRQITVLEIDHEIIATIILPCRWFKKGSCKFLGKVCAQVLVNR